ncbi:MAG: spore coat associated protein CotJA [Bacillota bacterium]
MYDAKRKPLVWSWPPVKRNGAPASESHTIKAELAAENHEVQPAGEESRPETGAGVSPAETVPEQATEVESVEKAEAGYEDPGSSTEEERVSSIPGITDAPKVPGPAIPGMELARAYVPYQRYGPTYPPREALEKGTLFPDLYRPYLY